MKKGKKKPKKKNSQPTPKSKDDTNKTSDSDKEEKRPVKSRASNYKTHKDLQICQSWLDVTQDPLNSTNQTADTFWERVCEHFMSKIPDQNQTANSIKSRWQTLQRANNKFHACYKQVKRANQSGANSEDRLNNALALYAATEKKSFAHLQCYRILAPAAKWNVYCTELEQKKLTIPPCL
jgi:hypothetical protein